MSYSAWAVLAFILFAVVDIFDGVAARRAGCDTAARRAGDVVLDRVAIHLAAMTCCVVYGNGWLVWAAWLSRDVIQGVLTVRYVKRTRVVVIGAHWHMAYGISMLLWGSAFILTGSPVPVLTIATALVSAATLIDYHKRCSDLEKRSSIVAPTR